MAVFRTEISIPPAEFKIGYEHKIMSIGSCFTENIGQRLIDLKFEIDQNPFGIQYNPISVMNCLVRLCNEMDYHQEELVLHGGLWHSMDHHGKFSNPDRQACLDGVNKRLLQSAEFLLKADYLILTLGTAWVYRHKASDSIVANCHKIPAAEFDRMHIDLESVIDSFERVLKLLLTQNPKLRIIFTVSPVRHLKDGFRENQWSKSCLMLLIDALEQMFPNVSYFPSYEIVMDDLRDYRFYASDLIHPNQQAVDYIWSKFTGTYCTEATKALIKEISGIRSAMHHRPMNPEGEAFARFKKTQLEHVNRLVKQHPSMDFTAELEHFSH